MKIYENSIFSDFATGFIINSIHMVAAYITFGIILDVMGYGQITPKRLFEVWSSTMALWVILYSILQVGSWIAERNEKQEEKRQPKLKISHTKTPD
jgi:membrane-anchored glycerophosphoryl diester phosphodiesterase (GDPDase)